MKPVQEIENMLITELESSLHEIMTNDRAMNYYNELLGDTSFLLAGLLDSNLHSKFSNEWNDDFWIDDSLLTNVELNEQRLFINGVMIWGCLGVSEQWVDPFCFDIALNQTAENFGRYTFKFKDQKKKEISYTQFNHERHYWDKLPNKWKYIIG